VAAAFRAKARADRQGNVEMTPLEPLRLWTLWTFLAVSAFAAIEPSPYEFMFGVAILVFGRGGLRFDAMMSPLIVSLMIFNAAGFLALAPYVDESESVMFTATSFYISLTAMFFAAVVAANPAERMKSIRSGYVAAAILAAVLGDLGYFNVAGLGPYFTLYDNARAMGPFKDPNVFGPFLVPPIVWLCQDMLTGRAPILSTTLKLLVVLLGVLLSFSRGAWIDTACSLAMLLALMGATASTPRLRRRTVTLAAFGLLFVAALLLIALAVPEIRETALSRASLVQDYDAGEQGRFGNQLRSIPMLLERPLGFGPFRFAKFFPADPHEVFLSAFASFGWIGGLAFAAFIAATLYIGWALCFRRSPLQLEIIALWSALLPQILQGVQIDTSHWRHLFLMCGCLYGLAAAVRLERPQSASPSPGLRPPPNPRAATAPTAPSGESAEGWRWMS
jgi:hypothetical protein